MTEITQDMVAEWCGAIGRTETLRQRLEAEPLRRYALAVGSDRNVEKVLPPLAHWAFFLPEPADGDIGEDGHPKRGGFLPAITLPRRMFASAKIRFEAPLLIGEEAELVSTVADVTHKSGRSGDLVFVEVDRELRQGGIVRVTERQSYVYRDADGVAVPLPTPSADPIEGDLWEPSTTNLFRFSAVTFNGHRIHYDVPYATGVEGYPALIVHGTFIAAKLAALAATKGELASFDFRASAPIFLGQPIRLQHAGDGEVKAVRCDGATSTSAKVTYK